MAKTSIPPPPTRYPAPASAQAKTKPGRVPPPPVRFGPGQIVLAKPAPRLPPPPPPAIRPGGPIVSPSRTVKAARRPVLQMMIEEKGDDDDEKKRTPHFYREGSVDREKDTVRELMKLSKTKNDGLTPYFKFQGDSFEQFSMEKYKRDSDLQVIDLNAIKMNMAGVDFIVIQKDGELRFGQCKSHFGHKKLYESDIGDKAKMAIKFVKELNPTTMGSMQPSETRLGYLEKLRSYNCAELTNLCDRIEKIGDDTGKLEGIAKYVKKRMFFPVPKDVFPNLNEKSKRSASPLIHRSKSFEDFHEGLSEYYGNKPKKSKFGESKDSGDESSSYEDEEE